MKKCGFEHQGASTYLVYELEPEDCVDSMSLGMLMNNQIPGFAATVVIQRDSIKQIKYNVTARVSADQYLLGTVNKKMLLGVFQGIAQAFSSAEEYMMDPGTIQLDLGSVFVDVATGKTVMICVPVTNEGKKEDDLRSFLKGILFGAQYDGRENRDYVAKIMNYLNGIPDFSIREFRELLSYLDSVPAVQQWQPEPQAPEMEQRDAVPACAKRDAFPPPGQEAAAAPPTAGPIETGKAGTQGQQKQISLFYLLQHYNKDNAAVYKEGKEFKKAEKVAEKKEKAERKQEEKRKKAEKKQAGRKKDVPSGDFAVPGQKDALSKPAGQSAQTPPAQPVQTPVAQPAQALPSQQAQPLHVQPFPAHQAQPVQSAQIQISYPVQRPGVPPAYPSPAAKETAVSFTVGTHLDTVYFSKDEDDATVLMGQEPAARKLAPYLVRIRNQERIPINKPVFRLGRDRNYNDYPIVNNQYIGHSHCHIICRDGEYFVVDDNSKNSTKVNGTQIMPGTEVKIAHGYTICLADEEFEFKLY